MRSRLLWRRVVTAAGMYVSVALGVASTVVAARILGLDEFGHFATAFAAVAFLQSLLDLTVEDVLAKQGFRYVAAEDWGRLRRMFSLALRAKLVGGLAASLVLVGLAAVADTVFGSGGLGWPIAAAALIPLVQAPTNVATSAILLRGRYDVRAVYQLSQMGLRVAAIAIAAPFGAAAALAAIAIAQALATGGACVVGRSALRRFPVVPSRPLGEDGRPILRFALLSSVASGLVSMRVTLAPLLLGLVTGPVQVGLFRIAQTPQNGVSAATAPVRLVFLTEQTRDWENGGVARVFTGIRRYMLVSSGLAVAMVAVFWVAMPWLVETVFGSEFVGATRAARVILLAAAVQLVFGWTKSFATTAGRPTAAIVAHGIEAAVVIPLTLVLAHLYGLEGAAWALVAGSTVFGAAWLVLFRRIERRPGVAAA